MQQFLFNVVNIKENIKETTKNEIIHWTRFYKLWHINKN